MAATRKCVCCGKTYKYCPACAKKDQPFWMLTFCGEQCKDLFNIVAAYNTGRVNEEEVLEFVADHNITDIKKYTMPIRKPLEALMVRNRI